MSEVTAPETPRLSRSTELALERTRVAYERTLLAWVRTATALITFGFTFYKFFQMEGAIHGLKPRFIGAREFSLVLVTLGLVSLLLATIEHRQNMRTIGAGYAAKRHSLAVGLAALISVFGIFALLGIILP